MKEKTKDNCLFQGDWFRAIQQLPDSERLKCYESFFSQMFYDYNEEPEPIINAIIYPWIQQALKQKEAYFKECERKSEARKQAWDKKKDASPDTENQEFIPPTIEEVMAYCYERHNGIDPHYFVSYYTSVGWTVGKAPMKDWKAAVRAWEKNDTIH